MPYIAQERRDQLDQLLPNCQSDGEVAYVIARIMEERLFQMTGYDWDGLKYQHLATSTGNLELARFEFERRVVVPYEDLKRQENGEVYASAAHIEHRDHLLTEEQVRTLLVKHEAEAATPWAQPA